MMNDFVLLFHIIELQSTIKKNTDEVLNNQVNKKKTWIMNDESFLFITSDICYC